MATLTRKITAEEYAQLPSAQGPTELVRGEVVQSRQSSPRQGQICSNICYRLRDHLQCQPAGHVVCNGAGILTSFDPDTVRSGDVWFLSFERIPAGPLPAEYLRIPPDIVCEVKSSGDRWGQILARVVEYLEIGVGIVCVFDPETEMVRQYFVDQPELILAGEEPVTFPGYLPEFSLPAHKFFE